MKKCLAILLALLMTAAVGGAYAQPLEELIIGMVREGEGTRADIPLIPNLDATMGVAGVSQGDVDAYGMLRGEAIMYRFESEMERIQAAWRLDAALTRIGFEPGDFLFEGGTYTLYSCPDNTGGILLMDGVTGLSSIIVLAGVFEQEGVTPAEVADAPREMMLQVEGGAVRQYVCVEEKADGDGALLTFRATETLGDGYDVVQLYFPQAEALPHTAVTITYLPQP